MSILRIVNRTENWKTAQHFCRLSEAQVLRLAKRLGNERGLQAGEVRLELFWSGVRDYLKREKRSAKDLADTFAESYSRLFPTLRQDVEDFDGFNPLKDWNYDASRKYKTRYGDKLSDNLRFTEIDIVLETPRHLFVGESKEESRLGTAGSYVLVHQLIRQYVMAAILVDLVSSRDQYPRKEIVPFAVVGDRDRFMATDQVNFMLRYYGLKSDNILTWEEVEAL